MWTPHKGSLKILIKQCLLHLSIILAAWFTLKSNKLVRHDLYLKKPTRTHNQIVVLIKLHFSKFALLN